MKLFIDTNVLIDYIARRDPFFEYAKLLRTAELFDDVELWCSIQSFTDAEYILRGAIPLDALRTMMNACLDFIKVANPSEEDLHSAFSSCWSDLEDYLIAACANAIRADFIITRDKEGFSGSSIPALSPSEFFTIMESDYQITYDEIDF